jgi:hypothetical protein
MSSEGETEYDDKDPGDETREDGDKGINSSSRAASGSLSSSVFTFWL